MYQIRLVGLVGGRWKIARVGHELRTSGPDPRTQPLHHTATQPHTHTHTQPHTHTHTDTHTATHAHSHRHTHSHTRTLTHTHTQPHTHTHTDTHTATHTHTHTVTHTHKHTHRDLATSRTHCKDVAKVQVCTLLTGSGGCGVGGVCRTVSPS